MFALPLELYELILLNLSVPELLRVSQVSRAFYQLTRWCLVNERYFRRWRVAFNEEGCSRRIIPLDIEETRQQIKEGTGFYIFTSNIRPLPLFYEPLERIDVNHRTMNFGMRFLDFSAIQGDCIPTVAMPQELRCGEFIGFKVHPGTVTPTIHSQISTTPPNRVIWKIELWSSVLGFPSARSDERNLRTYHFNKIRLYVSLEAIKYEYCVREQVRRARRKDDNKLCVCNSLVKEQKQEFCEKLEPNTRYMNEEAV